MDYVTRYFFAQQRFFLEQTAFFVSCLKEKKALDADLEKFLEKFDYNQASALSMLNTYAASQQAVNIPVLQQ